MLIVIPVGPSDALNLSLQTQAILRLGVVENPVLIVSVPSLQAQAEEAAAKLGATVAITEDEFANGWPVGPDRMFIWTIRHLAEIGNDQPWLWLEPDACPVKAGWDVSLAKDYREAGKPYYGFVRPTAWRDKEGKLQPREGDNMMLGVGIYPPNMHEDVELAPLLVDLSHSNPRSHPPVPWDIYLRWHMFRRGVHATTLIFDRWRTGNYTRGEFDMITCEPLASEKHAVGGVIPDEAVVVHGCKDQSLHRLVIGEEAPKIRFFIDEVPLVQTPVEIKAVGFATAPPVEDTLVMTLTPPKPTKEQRVLEALNKMDQPRLGAVASMSKVDKEVIKKMLPALGYEILNAGWIRKLPAK
jgi:hypothetical protein